MEKLKEEQNFKPTLSKPMSDQSKKFEKNFKKTMITTAPNVKLNEVDGMLSEVEQSLKKKIFSLGKMEALVFSDPKLSAVYDEMAENGEEKYGYHYNETIQNMIFNDYVLNSPKYLQKYKMAIPKEKKRRDKSGINQLKKAGEKKMTQSGLPKLQPTEPKNQEVSENEEPMTKVMFLVNEKDPSDPDLFAYFPEKNGDNKGNKTAYSHIGQHSAVSPAYAAESRQASPEEYQDLKAELESIGYNLEVLNGMQESTSAGSAGGAAGYVGYAGPAAWSKKGDLSGDFKKTKRVNSKAKSIDKPISRVVSIMGESNYLTDASGFEKYVQALNEQSDVEYIPQHSQAYGTVNNMNSENRKVIRQDLQKKRWDDPNIKDGIALKENDSDFEQVKAEAQRISREEGVVQHVNQVGNDRYKISDWYDDDNTVVSFENGRQLNEGKYKVAKEMKPDDVEDFAKTKHKGLPEKIDEYLVPDAVIGNDVIDIQPEKGEKPFTINGGKYQYELAKYADGHMDNVVYSFNDDVYYDYRKWRDAMGLDENNIKEDMQTMIQNNSTSMSNKAQPTGEQGGSNVPTGTQATGGGLQESEMALFEEINKELEAFSIHHNKLKLMAEDRKPSALVLRDRVGSENEKNFKKDFQDSDTKEVIDAEKELQWKDQQTDVGDDPQKLGQNIEKNAIKTGDMKSGEALKNVGDSTNDKGNEVPKRNLTTAEQKEINLYRQGLHSPVFDNKPSKRFEDRMKADMGEEMYDQRNKQIAFKGQAPMYNKDPQSVEDTTAKKVQFDKEQTGWNERVGIDNDKMLKESMITGRYIDILGKRRLMEFRLSEATEVKKIDEGAMKLSFDGLGNTYMSKTVEGKVMVNEAVVNAMKSHSFYTDGKEVFVVKNVPQNLNENVGNKEKPVVNEQVNKMKHLLGYDPKSYVNTKNIKL